MSMKRVVKAIEAIERRIHTVGTNVEARAYGAVVLMLRDAIAPDWKPASEPPDTARLVWVINGGEPRKAVFQHGLEMFEDEIGDYVIGVTHWHEIEVPEPPEVQP